MTLEVPSAMKLIYISGALTGINALKELQVFYESLAHLCEELGALVYVPHKVTDPVNNPETSPSSVFEIDKKQVTRSDLLIAYVGYPSLGVGMELAYAEMNCIPIILLYEKGKKISRFPRGIPTIVAEIQFVSYEDALTQIQLLLKQSLSLLK
ncbi:MAG: DUF4406 domain-containing protein [Synechococcales bacterium]|nr:DUF4406 domain-containing protein [Synechococcales bacterium]